MSSFYHGDALELSIFGQSHSPAIGVTLSGLPAGFSIDMDELGAFLRRRAPGQNAWSTPRKEADLPEFLSGLVGNVTCGAPLCAVIRNTNTRSQDYNNLIDIPRPGHADYTAQVKFGGYQDVAGGGHFSGRLTAPLCIAGGICKQLLAARGIEVMARIDAIAGIEDAPFHQCLFEAVSAFGTVGVSMGLTPTLSAASCVILIVMMYMGRVGVLTLGVAVFMRRREPPRLKYPDADVFIG